MVIQDFFNISFYMSVCQEVYPNKFVEINKPGSTQIKIPE
jgi:hypothetical protein